MGVDLIIYDGKLQGISELCKKYNVSLRVFKERTNAGWSVDKALRTRYRKPQQNKHTVYGINNDKYKSEEDMCKAYGINRTTFKMRIKAGWGLEKALTTPVKEPKYKSLREY